MSGVREVLERTRRDVEARKTAYRGGAAALSQEDRRVRWDRTGFRIFAEIKRASLSAGSIRPDLNLVSLARSYEAAGAAAISILTEPHSFGGSLQDLQDASTAVSVPLLQKDFVIDPFQIVEAKTFGASFVLLIVRFLTREELQAMLHECRELKMNALVEITDEKDLEKISGPVEFLGINSRNLETLEIDTAKFESLRKLLPDSFLIAESGINSRELLCRIVDLGYDGALIGEHFLRARDPAAELAEFVHSAKARPRIKICGITNERDAMLAVEAGADALGFIFAESPRQIRPETLGVIRRKIPSGVLCVGVFQGQTENAIIEAMRQFDLHVAQIYDDVRPNVPVWKACRIDAPQQTPNPLLHKEGESLVAHSSNSSDYPVLWDVKASESDMPAVWTTLATSTVFAIAGGLRPENVAQAVEICRPVWVDVARGVEKEPGIKDPARLNEFMKVLR